MREQVLLVRHDWDAHLLRCVGGPGRTEELTAVVHDKHMLSISWREAF